MKLVLSSVSNSCCYRDIWALGLKKVFRLNTNLIKLWDFEVLWKIPGTQLILTESPGEFPHSSVQQWNNNFKTFGFISEISEYLIRRRFFWKHKNRNSKTFTTGWAGKRYILYVCSDSVERLGLNFRPRSIWSITLEVSRAQASANCTMW